MITNRSDMKIQERDRCKVERGCWLIDVDRFIRKTILLTHVNIKYIIKTINKFEI